MTNKKIKPVYIFSALIVALFIVHFALLVHNPHGAQRHIFFLGGDDLFADFYNPLRYVSERDPYFDATNGYVYHNYLPFVFMFFYPFSKLDNYAQFSLADCYESKLGSFSLVFFLILSTAVFSHSLCCLCRRYKTDKIILLPILLSYIVLSSLERANIILLGSAFLFYFLAFYDSEDKFLRFFAAVSLAIISVSKIYPVIFGIFYFQKKQFKEIAVAAISALLLAFLPFLFFKHGFANIPQLYGIIKEFSHFKGLFHIQGIIYRLFRFVTHNDALALKIGVVGRHFTVLLSLSAIVLAIFDKNYFRKISLVNFALLYLPNFSGFYCALYIIPLIVYFFSDEKKYSVKDIVFFLYFILMFMPVQFLFYYTSRAGKNEVLELNPIFINVFSFCGLVLCVIMALRAVYISKKGGKE